MVIGNIIQALLGITGALALLMFVWGGFQWLISGGSPERVKKGKDTLIWATLGIVIIITAYTLVYAIVSGLSTGSLYDDGSTEAGAIHAPQTFEHIT